MLQTFKQTFIFALLSEVLQFSRNYSAYADLNFEDISFDSNHLALGKIPCGAWDYDNSWYLNTISQKFDLVCDEAILNKVASSTFFAGTGVGVFIAGLLSDKIGRKKTILIFIALFFASGMTAAFANSYELWLTGRFLWGAASLGLRAVKTVMSLEMVGSKWRAIICVGLIEGGWTLGRDKMRVFTVNSSSHFQATCHSRALRTLFQMLFTFKLSLPAEFFPSLLSSSSSPNLPNGCWQLAGWRSVKMP